MIDEVNYPAAQWLPTIDAIRVKTHVKDFRNGEEGKDQEEGKEGRPRELQGEAVQEGRQEVTRAQLTLARKALRYHKEGTPMKDAFATGTEEAEVFVAALQFAVDSNRRVRKVRDSSKLGADPEITGQRWADG